MPINNKPLYDAVIAGIAATNGGLLIDAVPGDYLIDKNVAIAIADEVDAAIPAIPSPGATTSERLLLEGIVKSTFTGRTPRTLNPSFYFATAAAIAAMYTELATALQDTSGSGSNIDLSNASYVDQATTVPLAGETGNIEAPWSTLTRWNAHIVGATISQTAVAMSYDYSAEAPIVLPDISISIIAQSLQETGALGRLQLPQITTPNRLQIHTAVLIGPISAFDLELNGCEANAAITVTGNIIRCIDCPLLGQVDATFGTFVNCNLTGLMSFSTTAARFTDCSFLGITVTFTGAPGMITMDEASYQSWLAAGATVVNGTINVLSGLNQLPFTFWVAKSTTVPTAGQNGNAESPFKTLQQCMQAIAPGSVVRVILDPDDYSAQVVTTDPGAFIYFDIGTDSGGFPQGRLPALPLPTSVVTINGCFLDGTVHATILRLINCTSNAAQESETDLYAFNCQSLLLLHSGMSGLSGALVVDGGIIGNAGVIANFGAQLRQCEVDADINVGLISQALPSQFIDVIITPGKAIGCPAPYSISCDNVSYFQGLACVLTNITLVQLENELTKLPDTAYVAKTTTVNALRRNGNIETPFSTIATALAAAGTVYVTPDDYSAEADIASALAFSFSNTDGECDILGTSVVQLPKFTNTNNVTLKGCVCKPAVANSTTSKLTVDNCLIANWTVVTLKASRSRFNGSVTISDPTGTYEIHDSFVDNAVWMTLNPGVTGVITDTVIDPDGPVSSIVFTAPGGIVQMDAFTYGSWVNNGGTITNGRIDVIDIIPKLRANLDANGFSITNFANDKSAAALALPADPLQNFPAFTFTGVNQLPISSKFQVEFQVEVIIYTDADHGVNGQVDFTVQAGLSTNGAGVVTFQGGAFNTVPVPNVSYLPAGLAGASAFIVVSANGYTVQVQRPAGVACHAKYFVTWTRILNVT